MGSSTTILPQNSTQKQLRPQAKAKARAMILTPEGEAPNTRWCWTYMGVLNTILYHVARSHGVLKRRRQLRKKGFDPSSAEDVIEGRNIVTDATRTDVMWENCMEGKAVAVVPMKHIVPHVKKHWEGCYQSPSYFYLAADEMISWGIFYRERGSFENKSRFSPRWQNLDLEMMLLVYEALEQSLIDRGLKLDEDFPEHKGMHAIMVYEAVFGKGTYRRTGDEVESLGLDVGIYDDVEGDLEKNRRQKTKYRSFTELNGEEMKETIHQKLKRLKIPQPKHPGGVTPERKKAIEQMQRLCWEYEQYLADRELREKFGSYVKDGVYCLPEERIAKAKQLDLLYSQTFGFSLWERYQEDVAAGKTWPSASDRSTWDEWDFDPGATVDHELWEPVYLDAMLELAHIGVPVIDEEEHEGEPLSLLHGRSAPTDWFNWWIRQEARHLILEPEVEKGAPKFVGQKQKSAVGFG